MTTHVLQAANTPSANIYATELLNWICQKSDGALNVDIKHLKWKVCHQKFRKNQDIIFHVMITEYNHIAAVAYVLTHAQQKKNNDWLNVQQDCKDLERL